MVACSKLQLTKIKYSETLQSQRIKDKVKIILVKLSLMVTYSMSSLYHTLVLSYLKLCNASF